MSKILLIGKNGQIGFDLQRSLVSIGEVQALDRQALDLTDGKMIRDEIRRSRPDVIVNAAAYTAVDKAESEPDLARTVNAIAPGIMAEEAAGIGAILVHYSTDYVFDGRKRRPYLETDEPSPLNVYGETKWAGERAVQAVGGRHFIFRTSWVYATRGRNFLLTVLRLAHEQAELRIVGDQIGAPTWSGSIAAATAQILGMLVSGALSARDGTGIYHLTGGGETSWHGFAQAIMDEFAVRPLLFTGQNSFLSMKRILPIPTEQYHSLARRPLYSVLSSAKLQTVFGIRLPHWRDQLRLAWDAANAQAEHKPPATPHQSTREIPDPCK